MSELPSGLRPRLRAAARNLPGPGDSELTELTARLGSMMPYRQAASVMAEFLPLEPTETHATVRKRTIRTGERLDRQAAEEERSAASQVKDRRQLELELPGDRRREFVVSIDTAHVRSADPKSAAISNWSWPGAVVEVAARPAAAISSPPTGKRMVKSQQMRWSLRGAHMLMQVRTADLNGELRDRLRAEFRMPAPPNHHQAGSVLNGNPGSNLDGNRQSVAHPVGALALGNEVQAPAMLGEPDLDFPRLTGNVASGGQVEAHGTGRTSYHDEATRLSVAYRYPWVLTF